MGLNLKRREVKWMKENINKWLDELVEVIYDDGKEVSKLTGELIELSQDYAIIKTLSNQFCIPANRIIKIKLGEKNE